MVDGQYIHILNTLSTVQQQNGEVQMRDQNLQRLFVQRLRSAYRISLPHTEGGILCHQTPYTALHQALDLTCTSASVIATSTAEMLTEPVTASLHSPHTQF